MQGVRLIEDRGVAARLPAAGGGAEAELLALTARNRLGAFAAERGLDRRLAVERQREIGRVDARIGQEVHLAGAVRGSDDDVVGERRQGELELRGALDRRLAVV